MCWNINVVKVLIACEFLLVKEKSECELQRREIRKQILEIGHISGYIEIYKRKRNHNANSRDRTHIDKKEKT